MGTILFLLLLYLLYLLIRPMIKVWRTVHKVQRGDFSAINDIFGQPGAQKSKSAFGTDGRRKAGWSTAGIRKKKIGKEVGEYVRFSEIALTEQERRNAANRQPAAFIAEQQVTDIEWEDIK